MSKPSVLIRKIPLGVLLALALLVGTESRTGRDAYAADPGACGNDVIDVPDTGPTFDFVAACMAHDICYGNGAGESDREVCDNAFLNDMLVSCVNLWPNEPWRRWHCSRVASLYYVGVRLGGWAFFPYQP